MKIPFVDLLAQYQSIRSELDNAMSAVINETAFIGGKYVNAFEDDFSRAYGVKHTISCGNGTDSLYIIIKMLGIGQLDEVITVANSWISSSETISQAGARPVFVDMHPDYYSINEDLIEKKISARTKAIIVVHLHGQCCNMDKIMTIARNHNLFVIEDCAQSHFSEYHSTRVGLFGIAASFSFYPGKNLGAYGDAGAIITNDDALAEKFKMFGRHGALIKHQHKIEGINSRMDGLQASILSAKLPFLHQWTERRIAIAKLYSRLLEGIEQIITPVVREQTRHTFHLYVVRAVDRDGLASHLKKNGIETAIHYPTPLPNLEAYRYLGYRPDDFPEATRAQAEILSLPIYPEMNDDQVDYVVNQIRTFYRRD
jgi:dTDP-4-amino-4,6-dideoxygalactose transaminase